MAKLEQTPLRRIRMRELEEELVKMRQETSATEERSGDEACFSRITGARSARALSSL